MLLDSNIIIYASQPQYDDLRLLIRAHSPLVSVISKIEVLGYHLLTPQERQGLERFFAASALLPLTEEIVRHTVHLRQQRRISLGDSIIAATALVHGLTLLTHNADDFSGIPALNVVDPLAPPSDR
jgi:predicted nucleic acid-binding protein